MLRSAGLPIAGPPQPHYNRLEFGMTKTLLIYERPTALNRERHRHAHLNTLTQDMRFAASSNSFLLAATELADAAMHYPTVFIGPAEGPFTLAVLVGLQDGQNSHIDANGHWQEGRYVPAFVRRYPFVLAQTEDTPEGGNRAAEDDDLTVCIDEASPALSGVGDLAPAPGATPLFTPEGTNAPLLDSAVHFLEQFNAQMRRTREFATELHNFGLLQKQVIEVKKGDKTMALDGLYVVVESRITELKANQIKRLAEKGYLGWVYAHLLSMRNVQRLASLEDRPELHN